MYKISLRSLKLSQLTPLTDVQKQKLVRGKVRPTTAKPANMGAPRALCQGLPRCKTR